MGKHNVTLCSAVKQEKYIESFTVRNGIAGLEDPVFSAPSLKKCYYSFLCDIQTSVRFLKNEKISGQKETFLIKLPG